MISGLIREAICVTLSPHLTPPPALLVMHRPPLWKSEGSFGITDSMIALFQHATSGGGRGL